MTESKANDQPLYGLWKRHVLPLQFVIKGGGFDGRAGDFKRSYIGLGEIFRVADRYVGQAGHADSRQVCLAHLLRDAQSVIATGRLNGKSALQALAKTLFPKPQTATP